MDSLLKNDLSNGILGCWYVNHPFLERFCKTNPVFPLIFKEANFGSNWGDLGLRVLK
jgi:hypothetical protein